MAGQNTYLESDGRAVAVTLSSTVEKNQVIYVQGWLGIANRDGASGATITLNVERREYQFTVPAALTVNKGDTVYVDVTDLTGHIPDDTAYYTASGSNRAALFKATAAKDAANVVTGILLAI
jgi:plastocyanin